MSRPSPRIHRLPHRLDYILIPAPYDLSLPDVTEKSPLPAIIVTPSSPSSSHDYSIAFLAPPRKPSLRERFSSLKPFQTVSQLTLFRTRFLILFFLLLSLFVCHVITHRLAAQSSLLGFSVQAEDAQPHAISNPSWWLDFRYLLGPQEGLGQRDFAAAYAMVEIS